MPLTKESTPASPAQKIEEAEKQYRSLLEYWGIQPEARKAALEAFFAAMRNDPSKMIKDVENWWQEAFGSSDEDKKDLERIKYEGRRKRWRKYIEIKRAGSKKKARKKRT